MAAIGISQSYVGHDRGQTSVGQHKVQFREEDTTAEAPGGHYKEGEPILGIKRI